MNESIFHCSNNIFFPLDKIKNKIKKFKWKNISS